MSLTLDFNIDAGYAGSALAILDWAWQLENGRKPMPGKSHYQSERDLITEVYDELQKGLARTGGEYPQVLVIGALGRCGKGALDLCRAVKIPEHKLLQWDIPETRKGGPFAEIRVSDVNIGSSLGEMQTCSKLIRLDFYQLHLP